MDRKLVKKSKKLSWLLRHGASEGLERSWAVYADDALVWHGTHVDAVASIAREGVQAIARTHVHLAPTPTSKVGKRAAVHVMLGIDPGRARGQAEELRGLFGLSRPPTV